MQLKEARKKAILEAREYDGPADVFCIWRVAPRQFEICEGMIYEKDPKDLVQMIHIQWAKDSWYHLWHPEYFD